MYKIKNPYKTHLLDLNLIDAYAHRRKATINSTMMIVVLPVMYLTICMAVVFKPEFSHIINECQTALNGKCFTLLE